VLTRLRIDDEARPRLEPLSDDALAGILARAANWRVIRRGEKVATNPPKTVVRDISSLPDWDFPIIRTTVEAPVFVESDILVSTPGYSPQARLFYLDSGISLPDIPYSPTDPEVHTALSPLTGDLLGDFSFVDESSLAHALAALLLPFVRPIISGPTPLHALDAPTPRTGKGLLGEIICIPATGRPAEITTEAENEAEWRKKITAVLASAPRFALIDNVKRPLDSAQLAAVLTASVWTDRLLGLSRMVVLPVQCCWLVSGNNLRLSNELSRRTVWIRLDSRLERPWERTGFRHPGLDAWARAQRTNLIHAALMLIKHWIASGKGLGEQTMGSFEQWARTMGGILDAASVRGFLANRDRLYERTNEEAVAWREFVLEWWRCHGEAVVRVEQLHQLASKHDLLPSVLGDKSEQSQKIRLGRTLPTKIDQIIADYQIESTKEDNSGRKGYRLRPVNTKASKPYEVSGADVSLPAPTSAPHMQATYAAENPDISAGSERSADVADISRNFARESTHEDIEQGKGRSAETSVTPAEVAKALEYQLVRAAEVDAEVVQIFKVTPNGSRVLSQAPTVSNSALTRRP
jgi:putative DNA primase/helicase